MKKYKVYVSEPAENDLRDIVRYISAQLAAPTSAMNMMNDISQAIENLAEMPQRFPPVTDERLRLLGYRKPIVKNYIVFYTIDEPSMAVDVERILNARRDWLSIL